MSKKTVLCLCLLVSLSLGRVSWAEEGQEEEFPPELSTVEVFDSSIGFLNLSLTDCIAVALKNNLDVEIARLDPLIGDKDISVEKAAFDPVLEATGGIAKTEVPINSAFITGEAPGNLRQDVRDLDTTVSMLTPIGMTVSMQYTFERRFRSTRS
ncbi:MAG: hypothetical protein V3W51_06255, partial [Candidatus Brocadiales bacterium]